jgi:hypothetical protein
VATKLVDAFILLEIEGGKRFRKGIHIYHIYIYIRINEYAGISIVQKRKIEFFFVLHI